MADKPILHGRDHRPGGADAVPFASVPWAYISGSVSTTAAAGVTTNLAADSANFYTNAPSVFDTATNSGIHGIRMLAVGHYLAITTAGPTGTPSTGALYEIELLGGGGAASFELPPAAVLFPAGGLTDNGRVSEGVIYSVDGSTVTTPTPAIISAIINAGSVSVTFDMTGTFVQQLDPDPTILN